MLRESFCYDGLYVIIFVYFPEQQPIIFDELLQLIIVKVITSKKSQSIKTLQIKSICHYDKFYHYFQNTIIKES